MSDDIHDNSFEHVSTIMQPSTPVRWTPEDAANFISATIHEAQKPTLAALKSRGVSKFIYICTTLILLALCGGVFYYFGIMKDKENKAREEYLVKERDSSQSRYNELLENKLNEAVRVTSNVLDNNQLNKELDSSRKTIASDKNELERLSQRVEELMVENKKITDERDLSRAESITLKSTLKKSEQDIAHIEQIKSTHKRELAKVNKHLELLKLANEQQKGEIDILRQRLTTAQKMVTNLGQDVDVNSAIINDDKSIPATDKTANDN